MKKKINKKESFQYGVSSSFQCDSSKFIKIRRKSVLTCYSLKLIKICLVVENYVKNCKKRQIFMVFNRFFIFSDFFV